MPFLRDAVANCFFEFRAQRQHGPEHFADRSEVVVGNPLAQAYQLGIEHRRRIEHADDILGLNFRLLIMQRCDDSRHALLPERHKHASADHRLHPLGNSVGEDDVERHRQSYVAEFRHEGWAGIFAGRRSNRNIVEVVCRRDRPARAVERKCWQSNPGSWAEPPAPGLSSPSANPSRLLFSVGDHATGTQDGR